MIDIKSYYSNQQIVSFDVIMVEEYVLLFVLIPMQQVVIFKMEYSKSQLI